MLKEVLLIFLSLCGFGISFHIWRKIHIQKKKLKCIIGDGGCNAVVKSKYGHLFGIDNTILGMLYYLFIFAVGLIYFIFPQITFLNYFILGEKITTGFAAGMSVLLTFIQFGILKQYCEYCTFANITNVLIFLVVMIL
ncbi:vitamin K epoxide reductase family protein [Candidatus Pacearchaeota archaeon]|nr:vitamin K epoxide reductase family protein [Candidatus Pacearchaeota archaeon]